MKHNTSSIKRISIVDIARRQAQRKKKSFNEELRETCLMFEARHWDGPAVAAIRDSVEFLMKKLEAFLAHIEEKELIDIEEFVDTVNTLEIAVGCLPERRLSQTGKMIQELRIAIEDPNCQQGESKDECILREATEKGGHIPFLFKAETLPLAKRERNFTKARAASQAAMTKNVKDDGVYIS